MKIKNTLIIAGAFCLFSSVNVSLVLAEENQPNTDTKRIVELKPDDFKPAFTRETVIKLNAIVRRSYEVINEFDAVTKELKSAMASEETKAQPEKLKLIAQEQVTIVSQLDKRSKEALNDMMSAVKTLKASDEHYNAAVLAGMVTFVKTVEAEVSNQNTELLNMLKNV